MAVGDVPTAYGLSPWISLGVGVAVLVLIVRFVGKPTEVGAEAQLTPSEAKAAAHDAV
jgi:hypothetical protein